MKTKKNADGSVTINSAELNQIGKAVWRALESVEKTRKLFSEAGEEFDETTFLGSRVFLQLKREEEGYV